jgi:hypothetical protein
MPTREFLMCIYVSITFSLISAVAHNNDEAFSISLLLFIRLLRLSPAKDDYAYMDQLVAAFVTHLCKKKTNSVAFSPQANYTD